MKRIFSFAMAILMLFVATSLVSCSNEQEMGGPDAGMASHFRLETENTQHIKLCSAEPTVLATEGGTVLSQEIKAEIIPATATNQIVAWDVYWITNNEGQDADVTDYVFVEPKSEGSTTATVYCHAAFPGSVIGVRATTQEGGFTATCKVTYVGPPTKLAVHYAVGQEQFKENVGPLEFTMDEPIAFKYVLTNEMGVVGSTYDDFDLTLTIDGAIYVDLVETDAQGNVISVIQENVRYEIDNCNPFDTTDVNYMLVQRLFDFDDLWRFSNDGFEVLPYLNSTTPLITQEENNSGVYYPGGYAIRYNSGIIELTISFEVENPQSGLKFDGFFNFLEPVRGVNVTEEITF